MSHRSILYLIIIILSTSLLAKKKVYIVPNPQLIEYKNSEFNPYNNDVSVTIMAEDTIYLGLPITELREGWLRQFNREVYLYNDHQLKIIAGIPEESDTFLKICQDKRIWPEQRIGEEG